MQNDCDEWSGARFSSGYGSIKIQGRSFRVHRIVWMQDNGPIPEGMVVRHSCDNPACINIKHLSLGTQKDNAADRDKRQRWGHRWEPEDVCRSGRHRLEGDNVEWSGGRRRCKPCRQERHQRSKQSRNAVSVVP